MNPKAEAVVKNAKPTAVILPLEKYEELLDDLHDLESIAHRKDEPPYSLGDFRTRPGVPWRWGTARKWSSRIWSKPSVINLVQRSTIHTPHEQPEFPSTVMFRA